MSQIFYKHFRCFIDARAHLQKNEEKIYHHKSTNDEFNPGHSYWTILGK